MQKRSCITPKTAAAVTNKRTETLRKDVRKSHTIDAIRAVMVNNTNVKDKNAGCSEDVENFPEIESHALISGKSTTTVETQRNRGGKKNRLPIKIANPAEGIAMVTKMMLRCAYKALGKTREKAINIPVAKMTKLGTAIRKEDRKRCVFLENECLIVRGTPGALTRATSAAAAPVAMLMANTIAVIRLSRMVAEASVARAIQMAVDMLTTAHRSLRT